MCLQYDRFGRLLDCGGLDDGVWDRRTKDGVVRYPYAQLLRCVNRYFKVVTHGLGHADRSFAYYWEGRGTHVIDRTVSTQKDEIFSAPPFPTRKQVSDQRFGNWRGGPDTIPSLCTTRTKSCDRRLW